MINLDKSSSYNENRGKIIDLSPCCLGVGGGRGGMPPVRPLDIYYIHVYSAYKTKRGLFVPFIAFLLILFVIPVIGGVYLCCIKIFIEMPWMICIFVIGALLMRYLAKIW
jgi:hypothetical protein